MVEARFATPGSAATAAQQLATVGATEVREDGRTVAVNVADDGPAVPGLVRLLDDRQLPPEAIAIREPTLDDVFLKLTGHRAERALAIGGPTAGRVLSSLAWIVAITVVFAALAVDRYRRAA